MTKRVMVVQVLIPQRYGEHPLAHQRGDLMFRQLGLARVLEATRQPPNQIDRPVRRPKQQRPGVRRQRATIKTGQNFAPPDRCKFKRFRGRLCRNRGGLSFCVRGSRKTVFADSAPRCTYRREISGLAPKALSKKACLANNAPGTLLYSLVPTRLGRAASWEMCLSIRIDWIPKPSNLSSPPPGDRASGKSRSILL